MDAPTPSGRGHGRGTPRAPRSNPFSPASTRGGSPRNGFNADQLERAALQRMDHGGRAAGRGRMESALKEVHSNEGRLKDEKVVVMGWQNSKAAANPGGGVTDLLTWLERKATGNRTKVNVRKVSF